MEISKNAKKCYNCWYYKALYTKGYINFDKLTLGLCCKQNDKLIEDKHGCCENFTGNFAKLRMSKRAVMRKLLEMSENMQAILQIMEEGFRST